MMRRFLPKYTWVTLGLVGLTLFSFLALTARSAAGDSVVDTVSVIVPVSCNLKTDAMIDSEHVATINNGTYKENIGTTTFKIFCNDNNGFSVYAIGYSDNEFGNTDMIATVNNVLSPTYNIATGLATAGDTSNWAMKLIKVDGVYEPTILSDANGSFADYHVVPTEYTKVATLGSNTDFTVGSAFQTTYRAYIAPKHPAGSYVGKVRYVMVHPASEAPVNSPTSCPANKICYNSNADGVADTMGDQEAIGEVDEDAFRDTCRSMNGYTDYEESLVCYSYDTGEKITFSLTYTDNLQLWASNFKRSGYGFAGWRDESGNRYGPNEIIDLSTMDLSNEGLALYADWVQSAGNFQNWTGCSSLGINQVTALTDTRDNNTYAVAKLADGNCWMIENLRLGGETAITLTPADSDVTTNFVLSASTDPTQTAWCSYDYIYSYEDNVSCIDRSMVNADNFLNNVAMMTGRDDKIYNYGNYYNWYSATAGSRTFEEEGGDAPSSICPVGWSLPNGSTGFNGNYSTIYYLVSAVSGLTSADFFRANIGVWQERDAKVADAIKAIQSYPNNYITSGYVSGSMFASRGFRGEYWSKTAYGNVDALDFSFYRSDISQIVPAHNVGKLNFSKTPGFTVRCYIDS